MLPGPQTEPTRKSHSYIPHSRYEFEHLRDIVCLHGCQRVHLYLAIDQEILHSHNSLNLYPNISTLPPVSDFGAIIKRNLIGPMLVAMLPQPCMDKKLYRSYLLE